MYGERSCNCTDYSAQYTVYIVPCVQCTALCAELAQYPVYPLRTLCPATLARSNLQPRAGQQQQTVATLPACRKEGRRRGGKGGEREEGSRRGGKGGGKQARMSTQRMVEVNKYFFTFKQRPFA